MRNEYCNLAPARARLMSCDCTVCKAAQCKILYLLYDFSDDTTLDFLLPTSEGTGACTSALVDFLVLQHNNFIERCRAVMKEREMR